MQQSYSSAFNKLVQQIEKLRRHLQSFAENGVPHSIYTKLSLQKRYTRCLQKLAKLAKPALKAGAALGLAATLHSSSIAQKQPCDTFYKAVNSNPLTRVPLPYKGLSKPFFVDIDGDGDYDCYEEYYDEKRYTHILFLKNNGTKEIPYFEEDSTSGFSSNAPIPKNIFTSIEGTVFVDIDGDGDYDCLMGHYLGYDSKISYFENVGNAKRPRFVEREGENNPFSFVTGYLSFNFALADIDNDGDYDYAESDYLYKVIYKNIGTRTQPKFEKYNAEGNDFQRNLAFWDWNRDGLTDLFQDNVFYKNTGGLKYPFKPSAEGPVLPTDFYSIQQFIDINSDSSVEIFGNYASFATTSPDASIKADSITKTLQAYPKNTSYTYRWQRNGKQIPNANTDRYKPNLPGLYTVQITGTCGTGVSYSYAYKTSQKTLTGEDENSFIAPQIVTNKIISDGAIKAYPNPFASSFTLQLNGETDLSKTTIRITDIQGRILQTIKPNNSTTSLGSRLA